MGISKALEKAIDKYMSPGQVLVQLGNQRFYIDGREQESCNNYFRDIGITMVSIDLNGKDGALKLDLSSHVDLGYEADIVTNFGTSEHVENQYMCFKNIYDFCKIGGIIIHEVPDIGGFEGHGLYRYTKEFFKDIYAGEIIKIKDIRYPDGNLIFCVVKKGKKEFIDEDRFNGYCNQ